VKKECGERERRLSSLALFLRSVSVSFIAWRISQGLFSIN
jgi:hypothetical protein